MQREIKFRAWDKFHKIMCNHEDINIWDRFMKDDMNNQYAPLMQYTGLKDKNGKDVYEGDLIDLGYCLGEVVFNKSDFGVPCYCIEDIVSPYGGFHPFFSREDYTKIRFEVIGNIYENPELLHVNM